ncbi:YfhJ family protein [Alkalihalobacillus sp. LMS39]|uniref:YfhJ family protein n=1 Tax=Alkalihalobacillus sp. LMS39 TaxID=2924032 RepID=UPI001FB4A7F7|nr:YfhJ family protein [Alkalihalobacillus sp. LMS39]UOE94983.1 YfhJ family protein [Alkalihalobacillus sp. LMS39]
MNERFEKLANQLLEKNDQLSYGQARAWVEGMWEDFEATYAKAGRSYKGQEVTEQIVQNWIQQYGPTLHEFASKNEKFAHLLKDDHLKH